jgi:hypothetical protein
MIGDDDLFRRPAFLSGLVALWSRAGDEGLADNLKRRADAIFRNRGDEALRRAKAGLDPHGSEHWRTATTRIAVFETLAALFLEIGDRPPS